MSITIEQLNGLIENVAKLRIEEARVSKEKSTVLSDLEMAENAVLEALVENGMTNYRGPAGMVSLSQRTSVKTPKTQEDREAFFFYLKEKGLYDDMISVNSQTLNSFYKAGLEEAREKGLTDFIIPGIGEVTIKASLSFRK